MSTIVSSKPLFSFLSTGEKTAMYTLRLVCDMEAINGLGQREYFRGTEYVTNLSTDRHEATNKAVAISTNMGLEFRDNADFELNEIKRRKAGVAKKEREDREEAARKWEAEKVEKFQVDISAGFMLCGKYVGMTIEDILLNNDIDYVLYAANDYREDTHGAWNGNCAICAQWLSENPQPVSEYIGTKGEKITVKLTVVTVRVCSGMYYTVLYVGRTEEGNLVKFFTTAKAFDEVKEGDEITIMAAVKAHEKDTYMTGSPNVTQVNRPKIVK